MENLGGLLLRDKYHKPIEIPSGTSYFILLDPREVDARTWLRKQVSTVKDFGSAPGSDSAASPALPPPRAATDCDPSHRTSDVGARIETVIEVDDERKEMRFALVDARCPWARVKTTTRSWRSSEVRRPVSPIRIGAGDWRRHGAQGRWAVAIADHRSPRRLHKQRSPLSIPSGGVHAADRVSRRALV